MSDTCRRCGFTVGEDDQMPDLDFVLCVGCASVRMPSRPGAGCGLPEVHLRLALEVTNMRLAIEIASSAIALGKYEEAREALLALAPAPALKPRVRAAA